MDMINAKDLLLGITLVIIALVILSLVGCWINNIEETTVPSETTVPIATNMTEDVSVPETTETVTEATTEPTEALEETVVPTTEPAETEAPKQITPPKTEPTETTLPESKPKETTPPETTSPATEPEPAEHQHSWEMKYYPEEGHYGREYIMCNCGYKCTETSQWYAHSESYSGEERLRDHGNYGFGKDWIVDSPERYEWICSKCGAVTDTQP